MREIVMGTAGHVDHGKTSLVKALTGVDTDRLKEEKLRGITIELGFAFLDLPCGHRLGIVDVPGHEKFVRNMVAGAAGIDLVAFVIAADEGIMPQTREHFEICSLLGVRRGLIILTKVDMVEADWLEMVQEDIREFFADSFLDNVPLLPVSSVTGEGIEAVRDELDRQVAASDFSGASGPFRLPVDRVFSMKGFGSVVTGTSVSGRIKVGDEIMLYPEGHSGRVRGVQVHSTDVEEVEAGYRTAINIQGIDRELISRGDICATPGSLEPSYMMDGEFSYLSSNVRNLKNRTRVRIHLGTAEIMGRIILLGDDEISPGTSTDVQLYFEDPACAWPGDHFVIRSYSPVHTIGGGIIFNGRAVKKKRFRAANAEIFDAYRSGETDQLIILHLKESGPSGLTADELAIKLGIFGNRLKKALGKPLSARKVVLVDSARSWMVAAGVFDSLKDSALEKIAGFLADNPLKPGMPMEELRSRLGRGVSQKLFLFIINDLLKKGLIEQDDSTVKTAGYSLEMAGDDSRLHDELVELYRAAGLKAPRYKEVVSRFGDFKEEVVRGMIDLLIREKQLIKVSDDLYFEAGNLAELKDKLIDFLKGNQEIDAQGFKGMTGLSRKYSIPLLEYFDRNKLTLRIGDKRILRERRS